MLRNSTSPGPAQLAFLIEGGLLAAWAEYPEVQAAQALAQANKLAIFDPVNEVTSELFLKYFNDAINKDRKFEEENQGSKKGGALVQLLMFIEFALYFRMSLIDMQAWIHRNLGELIAKGWQTSIPQWVREFDVENILELLLKHAPFSASDVELNTQLKTDLSSKANSHIVEKIMTLLENHPELQTCYGLWGSAHITAFENTPHASILKKEKHYCHVQLSLTAQGWTRVVNLHLFGGSHGEMIAYNALEKLAAEAGLLIPQPGPQKSIVVNNESPTLNDYFKLSWGRVVPFWSRVMKWELDPVQTALLLLAERFYNVVDIYSHLTHWISLATADYPQQTITGLRKKLSAEIKPCIQAFITQAASIDNDMRSDLLSKLDLHLFEPAANATDPTDPQEAKAAAALLARDVEQVAEMIAGLILYPTLPFAHAIDEALGTEASDLLKPSSEGLVPAELIKEYAGCITATQAAFFSLTARQNRQGLLENPNQPAAPSIQTKPGGS